MYTCSCQISIEPQDVSFYNIKQRFVKRLCMYDETFVKKSLALVIAHESIELK